LNGTPKDRSVEKVSIVNPKTEVACVKNFSGAAVTVHKKHKCAKADP